MEVTKVALVLPLAVAGMGLALLAAIWKPDARLEFLLFAWLIVVFLLMFAGPRASDAPRKRWWIACGEVVAAVYGPFVVAAMNTWLFDSHNTWMRVDYWKWLPLIPGSMMIEFTSAAIWRRHPDLSPWLVFVFSGLLSAMVVVVTAWLAAKTRWTRWVFVPLVAGLSAFGALALDAVMRA